MPLSKTVPLLFRPSPLTLIQLQTTVHGRPKRSVQELWRVFFSDPSQWWDHRSDKGSASYPDFKHRKTQEALWLNGKFNPQWVEAELAAMTPGAVRSNIYGYNTRLAKHVKAGQYRKTLDLFQQMQREGMSPDRYTFVPVLNACAHLQALQEGRRIHTQVVQSGLESNVYVSSSLIDMYAKCGCIEDACKVFNKMDTHDVVVWNAMIMGYVKHGEGHKALELSQKMQDQGVKPVRITLVGLLNACASLRALEEGRRIHAQIIRDGWESDVYVGSSLVDMYSKCGSIDDAWILFCKMPTRDVVSWNAMIQGYVKCGQGQNALDLYPQMQREGIDPDHVTFIGVLNACASVAALEEGKHVHEQIIKSGCESDVYVGNSLVDMYAKCGDVEAAWKVFSKLPSRDVVAWSALILGHVKCGQGHRALELGHQMEQDGVEPDPITFVGYINACASMSLLEEGRRVHEQIIQRGYESDVFLGSSLVDMYAKCGSIEDAWKVFNRLPERTVVCWNAMILGCVKCGQGQKALELFCQMQKAGLQPDPVTFVGLLTACASVAALEEGRIIHEKIIQSSCEADAFVGNSLVDMYAKCGSIQDARKVFNNMTTHNLISWNTMLGGYAMHGLTKEAVQHFQMMCDENVEMNKVTFVSLLSACSHGGLVEEGLHYFESMTSHFAVTSTGEHYSCIVDLLGRAGRLHEAQYLIEKMSCDPGVSVWMSLLGASRVHGNVETGEHIAKQILDLEPGKSAVYVLLSNIYAAAGKWESSREIQRQRLERGPKMQPECSWIEVNNEVHSFIMDDQEHPQIIEILAELKRLLEHMKDEGHNLDTRFLLHDVEVEENLAHSCHHSEKLAIAFGHICTTPGKPLRVCKNSPLCVDCHSATKYISKIIGRTIVVRDTNHFHHFENGLCSCNDYGDGIINC